MRTFKDSLNRDWQIEVTVGSIKRVKALCGVDLLNIAESEQETDFALLQKLYDDPLLLVDTLYALCKPEADEKNISDEDFARGITGDTLDVAIKTFLADLVDFFPPRKRLIMNKAVNLIRRFEEETNGMLLQYLSDPALDERMMAELETLSKQFMNSQESAE